MKKFKRIMSLVLTIVMLVSMIPMGLVTVNAIEPDYTISSVDEWNTLAAQGKDFSGKTVALGANINAGGAALATLSPNFLGTFEGNGYTISNATVNGKALIAATVSGSATIQNLKLANVDIIVSDPAPTGLLIATATTAGTISISKISIDKNSSVKGQTDVGGVIGYLELTHADARFNVDGLLIEATVTTVGNNAGGLIGQEKSTKGEVWLKNAAMLCNVVNTGSGGYNNGLVGYYNGNSITHNNYAARNIVTFNMDSVILGGTNKYGGFFMDYGTVRYTRLYITLGDDADLFGASRYASWINDFYTKGLGFGENRGHISRASMLAYEYPQADDPKDHTIELPRLLDNPEDFMQIENGFLTAVQRPMGTPTLNLENYDTQEVFVVNNLADWELIAASGKDFAGKKIELGADISGYGDAISPLAANFAGNFDGKGHKVFNATVQGCGVIANTLTATADVTIENLTLTEITVTSEADAGILIGAVNGTDANVTLRKINVTSSKVTSNGGFVGGLIGSTKLTTTEGSSPVELNIKQVSVRATVTGTADGKTVGGLIGADTSKGKNASTAVTVNVEDSLVICTVSASDKANGLFGSVEGGNFTNPTGVLADAVNYMYLNLNNIVLGGGVNYKILYGSDGVNAGVPVTMNNVYLLDGTGNLFGFAKYASWINGVISNTLGGDDRTTITAATMAAVNVKAPLVVTEKTIKSMVILDANGFIKTVPDYVQALAVQRSVAATESYSIRFIAVSQFDFNEVSNIQMKVVATYVDALGITQVKTFSTADATCKDQNGNPTTGCEQYQFLTTYTAYGIGQRNVGADSFGAKTIMGFTIYDIPVDATNIPEGITFEVTMSYTNELSQEITSRTMTVVVDATGTIQA